MSNLMKLTLLAILASFYLVDPVAADSRKEVAEQIDDAEQYLRKNQGRENYAIPASVLRDAEGIVIMRQYKGGFIIGGSWGGGVALVRDQNTRQWSPPSFVGTGEGSIGFQIGAASTDTIWVFMDRASLDALKESKALFGVDATVAAGPVGRDAEAKVSNDVSIYEYSSRAKGLFAGAALEGGGFYADDEDNEDFYGEKGITPTDILFDGKVGHPIEAKSLIEALEEFSAN